MIKALPTTYNGVQFRSRTEARWAAYFDLMGVEWRYEDEAYELPSGGYLPDFYLPRHKCYAEVKGSDGFDLVAIRKVRDLFQLTERPVLLLDGPPYDTAYVLAGKGYPGGDEHVARTTGSSVGDIVRGDESAGKLALIHCTVLLNEQGDERSFLHEDWWCCPEHTELGYGRAWIGVESWGRKWAVKENYRSPEVAIVRRATTTRAGDLIVLGSRS